MYASVRRYKTTPGSPAEISRRVNQGFVPIISKAPGFVAYYVVEAANDAVVSISIFQTEAEAEGSNLMARDWVKANIAALFAGPPDITAGTLSVHKTA